MYTLSAFNKGDWERHVTLQKIPEFNMTVELDHSRAYACNRIASTHSKILPIRHTANPSYKKKKKIVMYSIPTSSLGTRVIVTIEEKQKVTFFCLLGHFNFGNKLL